MKFLFPVKNMYTMLLWENYPFLSKFHHSKSGHNWTLQFHSYLLKGLWAGKNRTILILWQMINSTETFDDKNLPRTLFRHPQMSYNYITCLWTNSIARRTILASRNSSRVPCILSVVVEIQIKFIENCRG